VPRFTEAIPLILAAADGAKGRDAPGGAEVGTFEAVARVYLGQWGEVRAVARTIDAIRESGWLEPEALAGADPSAVADAWREAGTKGLVKLVPALQRLTRWAAGILDRAEETPTEALREGLRAIKGVGPGTADAILLEGLGRAAYPVDRATYRVLTRHGWLDPSADYDEARSLVEGELPDDARGLSRLATGFAEIGRAACKANVAKCERCPLRPLLPEGGPLSE
jgi:endonuclease-3 related protein